jgi:hypothetical protein
MRAFVLACVTCLLAAACTSRTSNVPAGASDAQARSAMQGGTAPLPDTAFIELRRDTIYGVRNVQGGCIFFHADSGRPGEMPGVIHETHTLSVDRMCRSVIAVGYRKRLPPEDTTGYESISASTDLDSAAIARLRRQK